MRTHIARWIAAVVGGAGELPVARPVKDVVVPALTPTSPLFVQLR